MGLQICSGKDSKGRKKHHLWKMSNFKMKAFSVDGNQDALCTGNQNLRVFSCGRIFVAHQFILLLLQDIFFSLEQKSSSLLRYN